MTKLRTIFLNSLLILVVSVFSAFRSIAQDTLYYSVENVYVLSISNSSTRMASNKEDKSVGKENSKAVRQRKDRFLVPFIISQIESYTTFHIIKPLDQKTENVKHYDWLNISINIFNNNLEYQFSFYENHTKDSESPALRSSSFFINPDNNEYLNTIKTEIQRLFEDKYGTNKPPVANIRIDGKLVSESCNFYRSNLDTIFLDGSSSEDAETPKKYLTYMWRVTKNGNENAFLTDFKFENAQQKLVIAEAGVYAFSLEVSDGVTKSAAAKVKLIISVIKKPVIELHQSSFVRISQKNICSRHEKEIYNLSDSVGFNVMRMDSASKLVFKYLYSRNKSKKYFLNGRTGIQKVIGEISQTPVLPSKIKTDTILISGLKIPGRRYDTLGAVKFWLSNNIIPGVHKYSIFTDFNRVTSNIDTVTITYREKHFTSVYAGYERFQITHGNNAYHGFALDVLKLGVRAYITQRLFADINLINPFRIQNFSDKKNLDIGTNLIMGSFNYDILPPKLPDMHKGKFPTYLSGFIAFYQLTISENNDLKGSGQWGVGIKPRIQLLADNPKVGVAYLEGEGVFYTGFTKNPYSTWIWGIKFIYGFWNY
jgi:hypothetical protein